MLGWLLGLSIRTLDELAGLQGLVQGPRQPEGPPPCWTLVSPLAQNQAAGVGVGQLSSCQPGPSVLCWNPRMCFYPQNIPYREQAPHSAYSRSLDFMHLVCMNQGRVRQVRPRTCAPYNAMLLTMLQLQQGPWT